MTIILAIGLVLQGLAVCILLWFAKRFADARQDLQFMIGEQAQVLGSKAEEVSQASKKIEGMAGDLHGLSDWAVGQRDWKTQEERDDQELISYAQDSQDLEGSVPISIITEARLSRPKFVAATLSQLIEEARQGVTDALQGNDYQRSESILARLHTLLEKYLLTCPWLELPKIYQRVRQVIAEADRAATAGIRSRMNVDEAVEGNIPRRLLVLTFPAEDLRDAEERFRQKKLVTQLRRSCDEITQAASRVDPAKSESNLELQRLEIRLAHLLSTASESSGLSDLQKASDAVRAARVRYQFQARLTGGKLTEAGIKEAFDRIGSVRKDLSQEILHGHLFEEIDKAMGICAFYFSVAAELSTTVFDDACHAISHKDFLELKYLAGDKQHRAYNSWALWLITKTKAELKEREPSFNPLYNYKDLVADLFPKVFNRVDENLLNPGVSRLFYELHGKLIDLVKKDYETVRKLINDQIFSQKVTIYTVNN